MSIITKDFKILDKTITVYFSEDNHAEKYFDFASLDSEWHNKQIGEYHLTSLLGCIRAYWYWFKYDRELTLETKGTFLIGKILHKHIQDYLEKTLGFVIIECPCEDELEEGISILFKIDIVHLRDKEISDIKTTRYMPIIGDLSVEKFEKKFGKYILQVLAQIFFVNNTYFKSEPMNVIKILYIDKMNLYTKEIWMEYDEELGRYFYLKIRARVKYLDEHILSDTVPEHCDPSKLCMYCAFVDLCPEGIEIKNSLTVPITFETTKFKNKYGQTKKPYWKYDPEAKCWMKSKEFHKFLVEELKYTSQQIGELP
nr:MAG: Cas4-like nuclease [uncultured archaeon]